MSCGNFTVLKEIELKSNQAYGLLESVLTFEERFPQAYIDCEERTFGLLFYDRDNPLHHDSNHAVLFADADPAAAAAEVRRFYREKELTPRVYGNRCVPNAKTLGALEKAGFSVRDDGEDVFMALSDECAIRAPERLTFRRMTRLEERLVAEVYSEDRYEESAAVNYAIHEGLFTRMLGCDRVHMIVGELNGRPVTAATLQLGRDGLVRVDNVETDARARGMGYGRELVRFLVGYFQTIPGARTLYLYSAVPTAIRIYREAGFREIARLPAWSAAAE